MELYEKSMSLYEYEDGEWVRMGDRGENFFSWLDRELCDMG